MNPVLEGILIMTAVVLLTVVLVKTIAYVAENV